MAVGALQMTLGGIFLVPWALASERPAPADLASLLAPRPVAASVWLVLASGVAGLSIYLRLIRDWGPTRAGMYAFVAPLIASGLGAAVLGERLGVVELAGGAIMLAAAALVLPAPRPGVGGRG
jgi:drug/metabolite transporter (DMT)-like permease